MSSSPSPEALRHIGWRGPLPTGTVVRVVAQHRAGYEVHDGLRQFPAQPDGRFLKRRLEPLERPLVGDFVVLENDHIAHVLPRRSMLRRAAAGERYQQQVIATNIDHVLVLTGLDGDFNPRRIERYLLLVENSGAKAVVLLSKTDRCSEAAARAADLRQRLPADTPIHLLNNKDPQSVCQLAPYLGLGDSAVLVGSSGAGKSTLTNTLLGETRMATGTVRRSDSRGRHTTTHRALLLLPGGACLIDTPGMRELKLTGVEDLQLFEAIEALAAHCRFNDCRHQGEPGCAVQAALDSGRIDAGQLAHYHKLELERAHQADLHAARKPRGSSGKPASPRHRGGKP